MGRLYAAWRARRTRQATHGPVLNGWHLRQATAGELGLTAHDDHDGPYPHEQAEHIDRHLGDPT